MVSFYFGTSCLFSCVRIDCQRRYEVHVGGFFDLVWVRVAYLVRTFGLSGLWVAFVKMFTRAVIVIPGMRASLSACASLMVHLQTAWNPTTRIKEVRRANAVITPGRGVSEGEMVLV